MKKLLLSTIIALTSYSEVSASAVSVVIESESDNVYKANSGNLIRNDDSSEEGMATLELKALSNDIQRIMQDTQYYEREKSVDALKGITKGYRALLVNWHDARIQTISSFIVDDDAQSEIDELPGVIQSVMMMTDYYNRLGSAGVLKALIKGSRALLAYWDDARIQTILNMIEE